MNDVQKGDLKDYWSEDPLLHTPAFGRIMYRDRDILRYWHIHDNEDTSEIAHHPLLKIKPIIVYLQNKFSAVLVAGKNLCIDESIVLWKGRLRFKQHIPLKKNRFGIKLFELVDSETGLITLVLILIFISLIWKVLLVLWLIFYYLIFIRDVLYI